MAVVVAAAVSGSSSAPRPGAWTVALAVVVLAIGYGYDLAFKGTAWSWVPFAVGIPLLPVFGWLGAAGSLPSSFAVLLPVAVVAGTGLAIANARADLERDAAAGRRFGGGQARTRSGRGRSRPLLMLAVVGAAIVTLAAADAPVVVAGRRRRRRLHRRARASRSAVGATAPGSSGPGSSRRSASGCWRRRGWPGSTGEPARTTAARLIEDQYPASSLRTIAIAFSSRSLAMVRYFARFARSVDADGAADLRIAKDADELVDRLARAPASR